MVRGNLSQHIDNGDIIIKKKNNEKGRKLSPLSKNYSNYLNKNNTKNNKKNKNNKIENIKLNIIKKGQQPITIKKKNEKDQQPITIKKKVNKKSNRRISRKSRKRSSKRRKTLHKKHTKSRRISFRCYPQKDNVNIEKMLKKVEKMSDETIKKELLKNGIEIKTNNNKLLKDMFMFSNMGGIRINKE